MTCKTHPDAPHGFDRNASHSQDRYVCECESWEPPEQTKPGSPDSRVERGMTMKSQKTDLRVETSIGGHHG